MIIGKMRTDLINAMRAGDTEKKLFLQFLIGNVDRLAKDEVSDESVIKVLTAQKKVSESPEMFNQRELDILNDYLPTLMSEGEIRGIICKLLENDTSLNIGKIMKEFNSTYKGKVDNKLVSKIAKDLL